MNGIIYTILIILFIVISAHRTWIHNRKKNGTTDYLLARGPLNNVRDWCVGLCTDRKATWLTPPYLRNIPRTQQFLISIHYEKIALEGSHFRIV